MLYPYRFCRCVVCSCGCVLSGCSPWFFIAEPAFDYMWRQDVYNILFEFVQDIDDISYTVLRSPKRSLKAPDRWLCVNVSSKVPAENGYFALNVDAYTIRPVTTCFGDYLKKAQTGAAGGGPPQKGGMSTFALSGRGSYASSADATASGDGATGSDSSASSSGQDLSGAGGKPSASAGQQPALRIVEALFPVNSYKMTSKARTKLLDLCRSVDATAVRKVTVFGVADSSGHYARNKELSDKRANVVTDFLRAHGLSDVPIEKRYSVEQGLSVAAQRVTQRRYIVRVELK